jgi:HNH endonuclease
METAVEVLVEAIEGLPRHVSNDELAAAFAACDRLTAWLSAAVGRVDPAADGAVTVAQWLRTRAGRSTRDAATVVRRTARVASWPEVAAAWERGDLGTAQVDAVVANVDDRTAALFAEQAPALVPALVPLSVRATEMAMRQWRSYAEAIVESGEPVSAHRRLYLDRGLDGWGELSGRLDPAALAVVDAALAAATVPEADGEPARTRSEQRADALVAVARHYLDHADVATTSRRRRPDVTVVVTLDELVRGGGRSLDGEPLGAAAVAALLCDAGVHRIVTDGASVVLDAGRTTRTVSHHLFTALAVRDGGCRFPGCDLPVSRCEAHHVLPWEHGGPTDRSNLVLLCWRHHHDFAHHPQWHLKLLPDATVKVTTPTGRVLTSHPPPSHRATEAVLVA